MAVRGSLVSSITAAEKFSSLVEREVPFLRQSVRRWHRDRANADDLVQETLVLALSSAHLWDPQSSLRGWLFTIMRNRFLSAVAAARRQTEVLKLTHQLSEPSVREEQSARIELKNLHSALDRLPAKQRLAILLVAVEGKSYEEVAESMRTTISAVRCHLSRGREKLRQLVDEPERSPIRIPGLSSARSLTVR